MTIPSGPASLADIQAEFSGAASIGIDEYYQNGGTGYVTSTNYTPPGVIPASGAISIGNFLGVSKITAFTFNDVVSSNTADYDLASRAMLAGWNGSSQLIATITINPGVYVYSTSTASPAFTIGPLPVSSTVVITNNGIIAGRGGFGATGGSVAGSTFTAGGNGAVGGPATAFMRPVSMYNYGTIGGGGGGGGGGGATRNTSVLGVFSIFTGASGGGGGGGRSRVGDGGQGPPGTSTGNATNGVAFHGGAGTLTAPGAGGAPYVIGAVIGSGFGGAGGNLGLAGSPGTLGNLAFVAGGFGNPGVGGGAGSAIGGGSYVSWFAFGTRLGSIDHPGINMVPGG